MLPSKVQIQFEITRCSSTVVKTIKKSPFKGAEKSVMGTLLNGECVTIVF